MVNNCGYRDIKTLKCFTDYIKNISVSVIGIGISNIPLFDFLRKCGVKKITGRDKNDIFAGGNIPELDEIGKSVEINYILGENYLDNLDEDIIFKSPGIRRDLPPFVNALNNGSIITSEIELFFMLCPAKTIAVTGSEGKTTTTTIIGEILKADGKTVYVGGNIGSPLLNQIENIKKEDYAVLELSSFQLFDLDNDNFSPNYAVITNITPNHLDWHKNMDEYAEAKKIIFKNQKETDRIILSFDNGKTKKLKSKVKSTPYLFSNNILQNNKTIKNGIYFDGKSVFLRKNFIETKIMDKSDIFIRGAHNILNFMAAIGVTHDIVNHETIVNVARTFKGVEHRIEFVREFYGVSYYNSTIDSSPTRTVAALNYFDEDKKIIVILGGYDKKISFKPLAPAVYKKAKAAVLYGETKEKIKKSLDLYKKNNPDCEDLIVESAVDFDSAVMIAKSFANPGDIVLLSPACASFGFFKNFAERGNRFKEIINSL